jgi:hypothetical protein
MRDPGTPFTADSFDEESLRALLDQVFPTSDSGKLAQKIRTHGAAGADSAAKDRPAAAAKTPAKPEDAAASAPDAAFSDTADAHRSEARTPGAPQLSRA